jgi:nicotinate-nucleotide pyrophosphorylase
VIGQLQTLAVYPQKKKSPALINSRFSGPGQKFLLETKIELCFLSHACSIATVLMKVVENNSTDTHTYFM